LRIASAALVVAAIGAGCSSSGSSKADPTSTATSTTISAADSTADARIAALFPTEVPSGFELQKDAPGAGGPVDDTQAGAFDGTPGAKGALDAYKFVRGRERFWLSADGKDENVLVVFQFKTASGAQQYHDYVNRGLISPLNGPVGKQFRVTTIPKAFGVNVDTTTVQISAVVFAKGGYVVEAVATGPTAATRTTQAIALAGIVYDKFK
jgi:hypothetical protein